MKVLLPIVFAATALGRDVPANVQSFIDRVKDGKCTGGKVRQDSAERSILYQKTDHESISINENTYCCSHLNRH